MASFSLITKATSVYFSKIRQARPEKKEKFKTTHDPERAIVNAGCTRESQTKCIEGEAVNVNVNWMVYKHVSRVN